MSIIISIMKIIINNDINDNNGNIIISYGETIIIIRNNQHREMAEMKMK